MCYKKEIIPSIPLICFFFKEYLESIKETNNRSFRRAARFYKWLLQQPEQNILVVSHSDFIRNITCVAYSIENIYWGHYLKNADFLIVHETN